MSPNHLPLFDNPPPDRTWVLEQGFNFNRDRWKRLLPDGNAWPTELDICPVVGDWPYIDRQRVFDVAECVAREPDTELAATQLFVAATVWGTGLKARDVGRRIKVLAEPDSNAKLSRALKVLQVEGPLSAYTVMSTGGSQRVKYLGPSFFTKFLYFAGYNTKSYMPKPVILDQHVARALNTYTDTEWSPTGPWSPDQYSTYLDLVDDWASDWGTTHDVVERQLFRKGIQMA